MSRVIRKRVTESWEEIAGANEELLDEDFEDLDDVEVEDEVVEEPPRAGASPRSTTPRPTPQPRRRP